MPYLKDFQWWPTSWIAQEFNAPTPAEISKDGILQNAQMLDWGLQLVVDYKGVVCTATIIPRLSNDRLILLRHILLQHYGEPMKVVEKIDMDFDQLFAFIK